MTTNFQSPHDALEKRALARGRMPAAGVLALGINTYETFQVISWNEIFEKFKKYSMLVRSLPLTPGDKVAIYSRNRLEWVILDWAIIDSGFVSVPIFAQSHPDEVRYILKDSEAKAVFAEDLDVEAGILNIPMNEVDGRAEGFDVGQFTRREVSPSALATIIYTSGTSGEPKGVLHTVENFYRVTQAAKAHLKLTEKDRLLSYLPLSHVIERVLTSLGALYIGPSVFYIDRIEKLSLHLPKVRPTLLFSVPRIWEMIYGRLRRELENPKLSDQLSKVPFFLRRFLLRRFLRKRLGLDKARGLYSGAARLNAKVAEGLADLGLPILQGYGLTETLGVATMAATKDRNPATSVGRLYAGVEMRFEDDGEICLRAPFYFKGYHREERRAEDAWFYTGDIGRVDSEGNLFITDRKKDLFKTSNGKYIAPSAIEGRLKEHPVVQEVVVVGDGQAHCVALAATELEIQSEENLTKFLDSVNSKLPPHEQVKSLGILNRPWTTATGELTPTQKVKRKVIMKKFEKEIEELYHCRSKLKFFMNSNEEKEPSRAHSGV